MISGKILRELGWPEGTVIRATKHASEQLAEAGLSREAIVAALNAVLTDPHAHLTDPTWGEAARLLLAAQTPNPAPTSVALRDQPLPFATWGAAFIDAAALQQMENAMRLPVSVAGALMPDAHVGYGLPIGGVLATAGAVIPYAVGVDIACRMKITIYPQSPIVLGQKPGQFERALMEQTQFGMGAQWKPNQRPAHPVLDDPDWQATPLLRRLKDQARAQLGTSGTGNHFVEWGEFTVTAADDVLGLQPGTYLALLSHSGSRAVGFKIADYYSKLAQELHPQLDKSVRHLAWLAMDSEAGQEYWLAMQLAGRFASANHAVIHQRVAGAMGLQAVAVVENHHNFAWQETLPDGQTVYVHRKGATPAGPDTLGIIPGSMGDAGYVVRGRGVAAALNSASHGAGRQMSRKQALESVTKTARDQYLRERGVKLLGGGLDEAPQAYKPIEQVLAAQSDLVAVLGKFTPRLVRMADEAGEW